MDRPKKEPVRLVLNTDAMAVLNDLAVNSKRKAEVVEALAEVAQNRLAEIDTGAAPADELTRVILELRMLKEQFEMDRRYAPLRETKRLKRENRSPRMARTARAEPA